MDRSHALELSYRIFARYGIKGVPMDAVAARLGVSKRTLYEQFTDKQTLLKQSIRRERDCLERHLEEAGGTCRSALEQLFVTAIEVHKVFNDQCDAFREELACYPQAEEQHKILQDVVRLSLRRIFLSGVISGMLRREQDYDLLSCVCRDYATDSRLCSEDFVRVLNTLLRGCCTTKGLAEMKRLEALQPHRRLNK